MGYAEDAAIINGATSNVIQAAGVYSAAKTTKADRAFSERMAQKQREWALTDWQTQNEYNSPTSQMARLREAGLNPNLVYGKGADNTAGAVKSSDAPTNWHSGDAVPQAMSRLANSMGAQYDYAMKAAQLDNLKVQNTVMLQDQLLRKAQVSLTAQNEATSKQTMDQAASLFPYSLEGKIQDIRATKTGIDYTLSKNEREAALNAANLATAAQNIMNLRSSQAKTDEERKTIEQQRTQLLKTIESQELDLQLKRNGIQPSDNLFMRILGRLLGTMGVTPNDAKPLMPKFDHGDFN